MMQQAEWLEKDFDKGASPSPEGKEAVDYVRAHKTHVGIKRGRKSFAAFTIFRRFYLNSVYYTYDNSIDNPNTWALFVHEVQHIKQGVFTSLSIYGEMEAWQIQFRLYKKFVNQPINPELEELLTLPLNMERANLRHARELMIKHAGKGYGANLLPLYPFPKEIVFWLTRRES